MNAETHSQLASFIWSICNLLRGPYKRNEYRKVILPLTVLRRFDCLLAPTKADVLAEHPKIKTKPDTVVRSLLEKVTGRPFYNLSRLDLPKLLDDPNHLAPNLNAYINGFSKNVREIMERFAFDQHIARMAEKNLLYEVIKKFAAIDLSPGRVDNVQMGYVFEELIRIGAEQSNEEAGEHFTPREVIKLMVNLLLSPEKDLRKSHVVKTIYDPACGTGGMLSVAEKYIRDLNADADPHLFGQDWNDESWAVCKSDMLIKGEDADNIVRDDTFTKDGFDRDADGRKAVQTLSRLNRMIPGKDDPFVLDFVNDAENIFRAFKPYFDKTELAQASDPVMLEALKHELDQAQVYHWSEVEAFAQVFYKPTERQGPADHAHMQRHLQPAVDCFKVIAEEEKREAFREKLSGYVKVYAFLSHRFADRDLEMLYSFGRFLLPHLPFDRDATIVKVGDEVALQYYRLERVYAGPIDLREGDAAYVKSPTEVGTGRAKEEKAPLSEIIEVLNERFGTQFSEEDRLFFQQIKEKACKSEHVIQTAMANPLDKFELGIRKLIEELMIERMGENDKIVTRYMADQEFQGSAFPILAREIFEAVRARRADASSHATGQGS